MSVLSKCTEILLVFSISDIFSTRFCEYTKKEQLFRIALFSFSSGGRTRTYDLRVMSPTSYQLLHSAMYVLPRGVIISELDCKSRAYFSIMQILFHLFCKQSALRLPGSLYLPHRQLFPAHLQLQSKGCFSWLRNQTVS